MSTATAHDLGATLAVLREHALALAATGPARVRVEAGEVVVELQWAPGAPPEQARVGTSKVLVPPVPPGPASESDGAGPDGSGAAAAPAPGVPVTAPTVGTFYTAPEPGAPPFVAVGDVVAAGAQVGIVEAMKLMIPVETDRAGRVAALLVGNGEPVEFGQPLVRLVDP